MTYAKMADAAFAANIPPGFDIAGGYIPGAADFHPWAPADWKLFPGGKLPITVPATPGSAPADAAAAAIYLRTILKVPAGCVMGLDLEGRVDVKYVTNFGSAMQQAGYKVWVYGQASTVFGNPPLNGYWVADFTSDLNAIEALLRHEHVRAVQYASSAYDSSLVKPWTQGEMWHG